MIYSYINPETGELIELTMTIAEMEEKQDGDWITLDGTKYKRDYQTEILGPSGGCATYPLKSDGAGVHPDQIGEYTKHSEKMGVPTNFDSTTGQAIFESRGHRKKYLKMMGMHDRNGGYGD